MSRTSFLNFVNNLWQTDFSKTKCPSCVSLCSGWSKRWKGTVFGKCESSVCDVHQGSCMVFLFDRQLGRTGKRVTSCSDFQRRAFFRDVHLGVRISADFKCQAYSGQHWSWPVRNVTPGKDKQWRNGSELRIYHPHTAKVDGWFGEGGNSLYHCTVSWSSVQNMWTISDTHERHSACNAGSTRKWCPSLVIYVICPEIYKGFTFHVHCLGTTRVNTLDQNFAFRQMNENTVQFCWAGKYSSFHMASRKGNLPGYRIGETCWPRNIAVAGTRQVGSISGQSS